MLTALSLRQMEIAEMIVQIDRTTSVTKDGVNTLGLMMNQIISDAQQAMSAFQNGVSLPGLMKMMAGKRHG